MKLQLFLLSVFVGVALGKKLECLNKEIPACVEGVNEANITTSPDPCAQVKKILNCFEEKSKICKDDAPDAVKNLIAIGRDLCTPDSQMNKDFILHAPCLQNKEFTMSFFVTCVAEYAEEFQKLGQPDPEKIQEYSDKLMNFACPKREKVINCGYGQMNAKCGEPTEKFFRKIVDPLNTLMKETCGDSASIPSISMALIFLHLIISFLMSRKTL